MQVYHNGQAVSDYSPYPDDGAKATIVSTMNSIGAALWSSQWEGWVPVGDLCPGYSGNLQGSTFTVRNLRVKGTVVQGVEPTKCSVGSDDDSTGSGHHCSADNDCNVCFTCCKDYLSDQDACDSCYEEQC